MKHELIPSTTIHDIVEYRNEALRLYDEAWAAMAAADRAIDAAHSMARKAAPPVREDYRRFSQHLDETKKTFHESLKLPPYEAYRKAAQRIVDTDCWEFVIAKTGLDMLWDATAKKEIEQSMMEERPRSRQSGYDRSGNYRRGCEVMTEEDANKGMPELTVENIAATVETWVAQSEMIFRRGIVKAFSTLDRKFRSHDGFKIGSRVILNNLVGGHGHLDYGWRADTLIDIERAFLRLEAEDRDEASEANLSYASILETIRKERGYHSGSRQTEHVGSFFRVKIYCNGNAHLWFTRDDLVAKVNRILADHYGETLGDGMTKEEDPLSRVKTGIAKNYGFYPTPEAAAESLCGYAGYWRGEGKRRVLEPSAGTGNLAKRFVNEQSVVDCVEMQAPLAAALETNGRYGRVYAQDFMALSPETTGLYDVVAMNPPFFREMEVDHVVHAWKFLKPGGLLLAILPASVEWRESAKAVAFRALMEKNGARWHDMPLGSFSSVGTNINTVELIVTKKEA